MTEMAATQGPLDPKRPWIVDEAQLPSRMRWMEAMFNPTGTSPRLHFTRVWTVCFFLQVLIVVVPVGVGILMSLAGGNPSGIQTFGLYASPIVFIATTIVSFIAHTRRLNDARKPSILAVIVLLPLLAGLGLTVAGISEKSAAYQKLYAERTEFLADPEAWRQSHLDDRKAAQAKRTAAREAAANGGEATENKGAAKRGRGGPAHDKGPRADRPLPPQLDFVLKPNVGHIQMILIIANIFIVMWSLFWVARVPSAGRTEPDMFG